MIKLCRLLFVLVALLLTTAACDPTSVVTPQPTTISIAGSTAMQPVVDALTETFVQAHPNVLFDIRGGGSHLGGERLLRGEIDLAATTLFPGDDSPESDSESRLVYTPIGLDGLAVIVNRRNPINELSVLQLRDLFGGRTLIWSDMLPNGEVEEAGDFDQQDVLLVSREDGSGSRALFEELVMGETPVSLTAVVMPSSIDVMDYVGTHPNAIGYVSQAYLVESGAGEMPDVHAVSVEGIDPLADNLAGDGYLLTQPLFLATTGEPVGWSKSFVDFVLSPTGQEIVERYHARIR